MKAATGSSHWELIYKKGILSCEFAKEFEVLWRVQSRVTLTNLRALRSSHRRCSVRKCVLRNFAKFTGKHLSQSLFFCQSCRPQACNFIKKRLWRRCFPVNFTKFLRTPLLQNTSGRLLLEIESS